MTSTTITEEFDDRTAGRNAIILATAQAFGGASAPIVIALGGLAGFYLLGEDKSLATLPVTAFVVGVALTTIPAAMLMRRIGRRAGFQVGAINPILGGLIAAYGIMSGQFWLLCLGAAFTGAGNAFVQQYRFAAADSASDSFRPKAISWVLAGGVVTGIVGPQIVIFTKDALDPIPLAGALLAQVAPGVVSVAAAQLVGGAHPYHRHDDIRAGLLRLSARPGRAPRPGGARAFSRSRPARCAARAA